MRKGKEKERERDSLENEEWTRAGKGWENINKEGKGKNTSERSL